MEITNSVSLQEAITSLELKRTAQEKDLSAHFKNTYESLQPKNIIKNAFQSFASSPDAKGNLLKAGLGLGAGLLSKRLFFGGSGSVFKKLLGTAVEFGVAKAVTSKSDTIVAKGLSLLKKMTRSRHNGTV